MRRLIRQLRFAWTVFCGVVAALILIQWGRSYFREDTFFMMPRSVVVRLWSAHGLVTYEQWTPFGGRSVQGLAAAIAADDGRSVDEVHTVASIDWQQTWWWLKNPLRWFPKPAYEPVSNFQFKLIIPYWLPVLAIASIAGVPWLPWSTQFSLRTLLIITTLTAVALAAFVLSRR